MFVQKGTIGIKKKYIKTNTYKPAINKTVCHSSNTIAILACYGSNDRTLLEENSLQTASKTDKYWLQTIKSKLCTDNSCVRTSDSCPDIFPVELFFFDNFFFTGNLSKNMEK